MVSEMRTLEQLAYAGVRLRCSSCKEHVTLIDRAPPGTPERRGPDGMPVPDVIPCPKCGADQHDEVVLCLRGRLDSTERFVERWEPMFGAEPWWDSLVRQHEYVGDWDGPHQEAIELLVFQLCLARGEGGAFPCPECGRLNTRATCYRCATCEEEERRHDEENRRRQQEAEAQHRAWYDALGAEERARYDEESRRTAMLVRHGLMTRDVQ